MYRLQCDEYVQEAPGKSKGRKNARPNRVNGRNRLKLTKESSTTPQYSIALSDIMPGLFNDAWSLPLQLIDEEIVLDITFSSNSSEFGSNDRAIFCPSLAEVEPSAITSVGVHARGSGPNNVTQKDVVVSKHTGGSGSGLRLLCDLSPAETDPETTGSVVSNIRVLDTGSGYKANDVILFQPEGWANAMKIHPAHNFVDPSNILNLVVMISGSGFEVGKEYTVINPHGENFKIKAVTVTSDDTSNPDGLATCVVSPSANENLSFPRGFSNNAPLEVHHSDGTDSGAQLLISVQQVVLTSTKTGTINTFDYLRNEDGTKECFVLAVEDGEVVEVLMTLNGDPVVNEKFTSVNDEDNYITINAITQTTNLMKAQFGYDPVFSYESVPGGKIHVDTSNTMISTDIIYFMDGKPEADMKAMNSENGIVKLYTQFHNVKTTLTEKNPVNSYGTKEIVSYNRLLGFSNSVLRSLIWNVYPSGTYENEALPYYGKNKMNPLLLKYCGRASAVQGGETFNVNINSIPYYSSELESDMRFFRELNKCFGNMYLNKGTYQLWNQCRQLDAGTATLENDKPSVQPGFTDLDDNTKPTRQYQLSDVKSAIVMDSWNGISQHNLRGMNKINGVSFELYPGANVPGNGAQIGSTLVDMNLTFAHTYEVGGQGTMNLYGVVERVLKLHRGTISVTSASF